MGKLSADEQKLYDELTARAAAPDEDDQFEIEIYDTTAGKGARVPFKQGKGWLFQTFGIGEAPAPAGTGEGSGTGGTGTGGDGGTGTGGDGGKPPTGGYFGRPK